jgi:hypothetical protein
MEVGAFGSMTRLAAMLFVALALGCAQANAQAGATPPTPEHRDGAQSAEPDASQTSLAHPPTADDICRTLEQAAAENALPVEFFARVIWQESRFNANAVSPKGAEGIAQFMPRTADWHGLADPFDPAGNSLRLMPPVTCCATVSGRLMSATPVNDSPCAVTRSAV